MRLIALSRGHGLQFALWKWRPRKRVVWPRQRDQMDKTSIPFAAGTMATGKRLRCTDGTVPTTACRPAGVAVKTTQSGLT